MTNEIINIFNSLLPKIGDLGIFGYWILAFFTFLESIAFVGTFIPGAIIIGFFGFLSGENYFDFGDLIWYAAIGAIIGDIVSFYLGKHSNKIFKPTSRIFKSSYVEKGEQFFKKHGPKSVFLGRFLAIIRPNISFIAGLFKMDAKKFYFYNITSAFLWSLLYLTIGYFVGQTTTTVVFWSTRVGIFVLVLLVFLLIIDLIRYVIVKRGKPFFAFCKSIAISIKEGILTNHDVRKLINKYPKFFKFLKQRFEIKEFSGLTLTLLSLIFIYILTLYFGIIRDVLHTDPIVQADLRIEELFLVFRHGTLINLFSWITLLCEWQYALVLSAIILIIFWLYQKREYIISFIITISGTILFGVISKMIVQRPRPENALVNESTFSFPSNHAGLSVALFGFLIYYYWRNFKTWRNKLNILFANLTLILLIGFSRLYLGVHYLSDVLGGYLLGILWLLVGITINEWLLFKDRGERKYPLPKHLLHYISAGLIALAIIIYIGFGIYFKPEINPVTEKNETQITISGLVNINQVFDQNNLSKYSETLVGVKQEPIDLIIIAANEQKLLDAFTKANWYLAETPSLDSAYKIAQSAILNQEYLTAPMTPSFWNAEVHDFGFQKPTEKNSVRSRHHVRFWNTNISTKDGKKVFVGTASLDINIKWLIVHKIDPDIDTEREFIFNDLQNTGLVTRYQEEQFVPPLLGKNFARDQFFTDGKTYIIELK
jgi:membrane protein DedA with SNARE-associated domain/membrane-associated phospholipid phosphatase